MKNKRFVLIASYMLLILIILSISDGYHSRKGKGKKRSDVGVGEEATTRILSNFLSDEQWENFLFDENEYDEDFENVLGTGADVNANAQVSVGKKSEEEKHEKTQPTFFDHLLFRHNTTSECSPEKKSRLVTFLLSGLLGGFGADRFYTGYTLHGVVKLLTGGGFGVWWIYDWIMVLSDKYIDANGCALKRDF